MRRLLLLAALAPLACTATEPPPPPAAPPSVRKPPPSLGDLRQTYLPRIEDNKHTVDSYELRKEEIVARKLEDLERLRDLQAVRQGEIDNKEKKLELLEEQLRDRKAQLEATPEGDPLRTGLDDEVAALERQVTAESEELEERRAEARRATEEIDHLEKTDREALFLEEMQPLYREGIELHLGFYRGVIELAQERLAPEEPSSALIDHINARIAERDRLLGRELGPEAFATLRREFELDQRMSQAWLSALILEVRFSLNEYRLESIAADERAELELLAESLQETWAANPHLEMYIDGHADSRQFRGETPCVSATKNRELSRLRAEAVRSFFNERLGDADGRMFYDWFGNFSPQAAGSEDHLVDRRIEIRIASRRGERGFDSHNEYFAMLHGLELAGRSFVRDERRWVQAECRGAEPGAEVEYLSAEYDDLVNRLGLDQAATVALGPGGQGLEVRLGNAFVAADEDGSCVAVTPCPDPSP